MPRDSGGTSKVFPRILAGFSNGSRNPTPTESSPFRLPWPCGKSPSHARGGTPWWAPAAVLAVVDRLTAGSTSGERLADSLELAFRHGAGSCVALVRAASLDAGSSATRVGTEASRNQLIVDGVAYRVLAFNT